MDLSEQYRSEGKAWDVGGDDKSSFSKAYNNIMFIKDL
jgi:hypothetical protein